MFNKDEVKEMLEEKLFEEYGEDCKKITNYSEKNIETLYSILKSGNYYYRYTNIFVTLDSDSDQDIFKNQADIDKYFGEIYDVYRECKVEVICKRSSTEFGLIDGVIVGRCEETNEIIRLDVVINFKLSKIIKQHLENKGFWERVPHF